jgi:hypothetical protein
VLCTNNALWDMMGCPLCAPMGHWCTTTHHTVYAAGVASGRQCAVRSAHPTAHNHSPPAAHRPHRHCHYLIHNPRQKVPPPTVHRAPPPTHTHTPPPPPTTPGRQGALAPQANGAPPPPPPPPSRQTLADLRPPNRTPSTGSPPSRCLYQTPAAVGGRAEHP